MAKSSPAEVRLEGIIRLHHGTDENSAQDLLLHGLASVRAAAFNVSGEFWATTSPADADAFAQVNPAAGVPARYSFDLPRWVLGTLMGASPPAAYQHISTGTDWYEFLPGGFRLLNLHMANREVVSPVP